MSIVGLNNFFELLIFNWNLMIEHEEKYFHDLLSIHNKFLCVCVFFVNHKFKILFRVLTINYQSVIFLGKILCSTLYSSLVVRFLLQNIKVNWTNEVAHLNHYDFYIFIVYSHVLGTKWCFWINPFKLYILTVCLCCSNEARPERVERVNQFLACNWSVVANPCSGWSTTCTSLAAWLSWN